MFCTNCGKEFKGNFCPYCGAKAAIGNVCPVCKRIREIGEKFCADCGYRFEDSGDNRVNADNDFKHGDDKADETPKQSGDGAEKTKKRKIGLFDIYSLLYYAPAILFLIFSALVFAFYAAPLATSPAIKDLGVPAESYGNVYTIANDLPDLKGVTTFLIIFAVLNLTAAIIIACVALNKKRKTAVVNLFGKKISGFYVFCATETILSVAFFIVGIVISAKIKNIGVDEGVGELADELIAVGACPKLLIAFSVITVVLTAGAVFGRIFIAKRNPDFVATEAERCIAAKKEWLKNIEPDTRLTFDLSESTISNYSITHSASVTVYAALIISAVCAAVGGFILFRVADPSMQFVALIVTCLIFLFVGLFVCSLSGLWVGGGKVMKKRSVFTLVLIALSVVFVPVGVAFAQKSNAIVNGSEYNKSYVYYDLDKSNECLTEADEAVGFLTNWQNDFQRNRDNLQEYKDFIEAAINDGTLTNDDLQGNYVSGNILYIDSQSDYVAFLYSADGEENKLAGEGERGSATLFYVSAAEGGTEKSGYSVYFVYLYYVPFGVEFSSMAEEKLNAKSAIAVDDLLEIYDVGIRTTGTIIGQGIKTNVSNRVENLKEDARRNGQGDMSFAEYKENADKTHAELERKYLVYTIIASTALGGTGIFFVIAMIIGLTCFVRLVKTLKKGKSANLTVGIIKKEMSVVPALKAKKSSFSKELTELSKQKNYKAFIDILTAMHNEFLAYLDEARKT